MRRTFHRPEFRLVIPGEAISFRSANAWRYKELVQSIVRPVFTYAPATGPVEVRLDYFHLVPRICDMDNISKCVLDALNGIVYVDDLQVRLQTSCSHDLSKATYLSGVPVDIVKPLSRLSEYLFVRLRLLDGQFLSS